MHQGLVQLGCQRARLRINRQPPEYTALLGIDPDADFSSYPGSLAVKTLAYGKCPVYWDRKFDKWHELL